MPEMTNSQILETPDHLLTGIDKQRKYCMRLNLIEMPCPNCGTKQNVYQAGAFEINDDDFGVTKRVYFCITCKRKLEHCVPLLAGPGCIWVWELSKKGEGADFGAVFIGKAKASGLKPFTITEGTLTCTRCCGSTSLPKGGVGTVYVNVCSVEGIESKRAFVCQDCGCPHFLVSSVDLLPKGGPPATA